MQQGPLVRFVACGELLGMLIEQRAQRLDLATAGSVKQLAFEAQRIDMGLERAPARESVPPGDRELRVGEFGLRIGFTELVEMTLGVLRKPLELGLMTQTLGVG